ncbi:MAG: gliding motility-associated C-terminal domain-containing protein [Taibaiella sp.]|nr:gliding motility-associated C-terminal domain-containing protein [Taibaiella sp.]
MKKFTPFLLVCVTLLLALIPTTKVQASHAAGAEITYTWVSDSTYDFIYHFYRDCTGIPEPDSTPFCYVDNCDPTLSGSTYLIKTVKILGADGNSEDNGTEVLKPCPGHPTTCAGGTIPGYEEWWYKKRITLPGRCDNWVFSHAENARNGAVLNIAGGSLYVEATLNNIIAISNSSAYFTVKPVPYICKNIPYSYNNAAFDPDGDSLYFETINPLTSSGDCASPSNDNYLSGYSLPSNPLACGGTFTFSNVTGQMSFTPNATGEYVITVRVKEYRSYSGVWKLVGTVMRDIQIVVLGCNTPNPSLTTINSTLTGATSVSGTIYACATVPFNFCFDAKSPDTTAILVVKDNHRAFTASGTTSITVTYTHTLTDSIRGCLSWTPGLTDTGLKVFTVTVTDSSCKGISIPISNTFVIPIFVEPVTKILKAKTICPGDSVSLLAVGGGNFSWDVLPGGSAHSSISCDSCKTTMVRPTTTTQYTVHSKSNIYCAKNRDTVTITVVPAPYSARYDTAACVGSTIQLYVPVTAAPAGVATAIKWSPTVYLSSSTINNPFVTPLLTTSYIVTITYGGLTACSTKDTVNVKALKYFQLLTKDTTICKNISIPINAIGDSRFNYVWTPVTGVSDPSSLTPVITADTTRTYTLTSHHVACPDSSASITITVQPTPLVSAGPDKTICAGDTVHLFGTVTPASFAYTYHWTPDTTVNDPFSISTVFIGKKTTKLVLSAGTGAGCIGTDTMVVNVIPANFLHVSQDTGICPGDTAHLHATGDSIVAVSWVPNIFMSDSSSLNPNVYPGVSETYTVRAVNQKNCRDTQSVHVNVSPAAVIQLRDSALIYPGDSVQLSPSGNCLYYNWFPPAGLSATNISNPFAKPDVNTRYVVIGHTEAGCIAKDSIDVYVAYDSYINIANAFTPGSGPGNILRVQHLGDATLKSFTIYNRWGVKVFQSTDVNVGWDGTYNGQPQPLGVYIYMVEAVTYRGKPVYKQGNVTLLR